MGYDIRSQNVMLDSDLADLYGVEIKVMNQAIKRNIERFPVDFMFQLINGYSKFQNGISSKQYGGRLIITTFAENGDLQIRSSV